MPEARIYRPTKNAMQSGTANTRRWVLEFEPACARAIDPADRLDQLAPTPASKCGSSSTIVTAAVAYAEANGIAHQVSQPNQAKPKIKSYADNFRYDRVELAGATR